MSHVHTHAHQPAHHAPAGRKAMKKMKERLRRDQHELVRDLQDRAARLCPRNDEGPPPRID